MSGRKSVGKWDPAVARMRELLADTDRLDWVEERQITLIAPPDQTGEDYHGIDNEWAVRGPYGETRRIGLRAAVDAGIIADGWTP